MSKFYYGDIEVEAKENLNFRKVLFTGGKTQLVLMSIPVGGEIGLETHEHVDQFFRVESGVGKAIVAGEELELRDGVAVIVTAGTLHNFINTGEAPLKLYTLYSPPNHIDGRIHQTKEDADADMEDEEFGHSIK